MKKTLILMALLLALSLFAQAQDDTDTTDTTTDTGDQSTVNWFITYCENRAVVDLNGTMQPGFDVYFQVFRGQATAEALTELRRISVNGAYQISAVVEYTGGTVGVSDFVTGSIAIASENDPTNTIFQQDDVDLVATPCPEPANPLTNALGTNVIELDEIDSADPVIFTPDGGIYRANARAFTGTQVINTATGETAVAEVTPEPVVQIGARQSDQIIPGRSSHPGLIFAECSKFPGIADPGTLFDTDEIVIFWSWFAATPELVQQHLLSAVYNISVAGQPITEGINVSPIVQREDGNYWAFYTLNLGDAWRPGEYGVSFWLTWQTPISDGFEEFGPGTANPSMGSGCDFEIQPNPFGVTVIPEQPAVPLRIFD